MSKGRGETPIGGASFFQGRQQFNFFDRRVMRGQVGDEHRADGIGIDALEWFANSSFLFFFALFSLPPPTTP